MTDHLRGSTEDAGPSSHRARDLPPMKRPAPAPPVSKTTTFALPGEEARKVSQNYTTTSGTTTNNNQTHKRQNSSSSNDGDSCEEKGGSLSKKKFLDWRKKKKDEDDQESGDLGAAGDHHLTTKKKKKKNKDKKSQESGQTTHKSSSKSRSEAGSADEIDTQLDLESINQDKPSTPSPIESPRAGRAPTLVRRSIQRVVEDWAGDEAHIMEEDTKRRSGMGPGFFDRPTSVINQDDKRRRKEMRKEREELHGMFNDTNERLDKVEKTVEKLGRLLEQHHDKQTLELSRFLMVISGELTTKKEDNVRQAVRIEALERSLQETKQEMMEALVLNAKKVELLARKDKRIEELEYLLRCANEGIDVSDPVARHTAIAQERMRTMVPLNPGESKQLANGHHHHQQQHPQVLASTREAGGMPSLSLSLEVPRNAPRGSPKLGRKRADSCLSANDRTDEAAPPLFSPGVIPSSPTTEPSVYETGARMSQIIMMNDIGAARAARAFKKRAVPVEADEMPELVGGEGAEVQIRVSGEEKSGEKEKVKETQGGEKETEKEKGSWTLDEVDGNHDDGDGFPTHVKEGGGTLTRATAARYAKQSKAMRTLGITASQEKLMNVLGLDMPPEPDHLTSNATDVDLNSGAVKTPKTPKQVLKVLMAGGKKKDNSLSSTIYK